MGQPLRSLPQTRVPESDCRCLCGNLLARLVDGGVELKCRRCKRTHVVPLAAPGTPAVSARVGSSGKVTRS